MRWVITSWASACVGALVAGFVEGLAMSDPFGVVQEFDTTLAGQANTGHTGYYYNGKIDWKSGTHLADLIEYLKTL